MSGPWMPTTAEVREMYASDEMGEYMDVAGQWFDRWLESERRAAKADGMRNVADWLEGGTPRAYGFHHPCDPPGVRWEPNADQRRLLYAVDAIREAADRIENGDRHVDQ